MSSNAVVELRRTESTDAGPTPLFSIVIPAFDREDTIERCVRSCLDQDHGRFEVVVVDDASTDRTAEILERMADPRLRVLRLPENRQVSHARNRGSEAARGEWLVYLDSDDVLLPGYLRRMEDAISNLPAGLSVIASPYLRDDGPMCPQPFPDKEILEFEDYLRWQDVIVGSNDILICRRKETWERFPWPETRARQALTWFRLYTRYPIYLVKEPGGQVYTDARNRHNSDVSAAARARRKRDGKDTAESRITLMTEFGEQLRRIAPRTHQMYLRSIGNLYFHSGCRRLGAKHMLRYLLQYPASAKGWINLILGLIGPEAILRAVGTRKQRPAKPQQKVNQA